MMVLYSIACIEAHDADVQAAVNKKKSFTLMSY